MNLGISLGSKIGTFPKNLQAQCPDSPSGRAGQGVIRHLDVEVLASRTFSAYELVLKVPTSVLVPVASASASASAHWPHTLPILD